VATAALTPPDPSVATAAQPWWTPQVATAALAPPDPLGGHGGADAAGSLSGHGGAAVVDPPPTDPASAFLMFILEG